MPSSSSRVAAPPISGGHAYGEASGVHAPSPTTVKGGAASPTVKTGVPHPKTTMMMMPPHQPHQHEHEEHDELSMPACVGLTCTGLGLCAALAVVGFL